MSTQYYIAASLDGFIATADDSMDWLFPLGNIGDTGYADFIRDVGALAMGSTTYQWILRHVIRRPAQGRAAWPYRQPTWVFSRRQQPGIDGADIRFVHGEVGPIHRQMETVADGKNIWLVGGGELAGQFFDANLLDEIIVQLGSVTLGTGKPLLPRLIVSPPLALLSARTLGSGLAELRYQVHKKSAGAKRHAA